VTQRLHALTRNGHAADKVELIVKGGTCSAYPWDYQQWFIKRCFDACNHFAAVTRSRTTSLAEAQTVNETAGNRIIGITLETRPDWIRPQEIVRLRTLGCTRVELGVQSVNDRLLEITKRGHDVASVVSAARLLRDAGFKTDFHMMPQLPEATPASDLAELREIFDNPDFRPDMIKIYPCVTVELAELHDWWKDGRYIPYPDAELVEMLIEAKRHIPRYCRISRLIRDIPSTSIVAGNAVTNLRQTVQDEMAKRGLQCACLRCREIGRAAQSAPALLHEAPVLQDDAYEAGGGTEHFLSFEDAARRAVFAFCRLRLPPRTPQNADVAAVHAQLPELQGVALIRELHTYGHLVPIDERKPEASQHKGLGRALMAEAERLAREAGYEKMAVISGVGVREYYRKLGYALEGTYMTKKLRD
jgi:elongator complex protein 3